MAFSKMNERTMRYAAIVVLLCLAGCAGRVVPGPAVRPPPPGKVLASVPVGSPPTLLAMAPDGRHLYAASNGALSVIDTATNSEQVRLSINPNSTAVAVAPDGSKVYVASLFSIRLTVLDTATNTLGAPVTMFSQRQRGGFGFMAIAPDGRTIYIANTANRGLGIIRLDGTGSMLRPTVFPVDVALSSDGRTLYTAGCKRICTPGFVNLYDTVARRFGDEIAVDGNPLRIVLSPDGTRAYVANRSGPTISVVDLAARLTIETIRVPAQPTGLAIAPDGGTLYVASQTEGQLTALDVASGTARGRLAAPQARDVAVSPDGQRVYVSTPSAVLVVDARALVGGEVDRDR